jgi:hypothetical protein
MAVTTPSGLPAAFLEPFAEKVTDILAQQIAPIEEGLDISAITPKVAAVSPLVQQAQQRAATQAGLGQLQFDPTTGEVTGVGAGTGVAAFEPFVQEAQRLAAPEQYQAFMSPFQTEVLDATQALLEEQRAAGRAGRAAEAISAGAFGGGREGVRRAEYERQRDIYDAGILANLRQQGLQQAQTLQQQALANQLGIGQAQQQLDISATSRLGQAGTGAQAYSQSVLDAIRQGNILAEEFPLQQLGRATNIFSPFLTGAAALQQPATPIGTSPGLAAAQAFGATFGPVLQSTGRTSLQPQQQQPTGGQFGIASLYGGI